MLSKVCGGSSLFLVLVVREAGAPCFSPLCLGILWQRDWVYCGGGVRYIVIGELGVLCSSVQLFCVLFVLR